MGRYISPSASTTGTATTSTTAFCNYLPAAPRSPFTNRCIYDSPGTYCFTVPSGVCTIRVVTVGGGGASCSRVDPNPLEVAAFNCATVRCMGFYNNLGIHKLYTCIVSQSGCANYCNCPACGSVGIQSFFTCIVTSGSPECGCICCHIICGNLCLGFMPQVGNPSAGTTYKVETCMVSSQRITAPSGGYADGCLAVTPGCAYTVTVGNAGGTSGFGTFISATGGSVSITQRPSICCSPFNSCVIVCGTSSTCTPIAISTNFFNYACTFYMWDCGHCFIHRYENQCAQATLTAGVGTAWSGMCNVIVRSGAAGTIFDVGENFVSQVINANSCNCNRSVLCYINCFNAACYSPSLFCYCAAKNYYYATCEVPPCCASMFVGVSTSYSFKRVYPGGSAGNYFGDGIPTTCYTGCFIPASGGNSWIIAGNYGTPYFGLNNVGNPPIFTTCGITCGISCVCQVTNNCCVLYCVSNYAADCCCARIYGTVGGAGIRSPGNFALAGSGRAPACCAYVPDALQCTCSFMICQGNNVYYAIDDVNLRDLCYCVNCYAVACCCPVCVYHIPSVLEGTCYWYPEDMCGHSSTVFSARDFNCSIVMEIGGQPGAGAYSRSCNIGSSRCFFISSGGGCLAYYNAGVLGGGVREYCVTTLSDWNSVNGTCVMTRDVCGNNEARVIGGSTGHGDTRIQLASIQCGVDHRCVPGGKGMVIVYY